MAAKQACSAPSRQARHTCRMGSLAGLWRSRSVHTPCREAAGNSALARIASGARGGEASAVTESRPFTSSWWSRWLHQPMVSFWAGKLACLAPCSTAMRTLLFIVTMEGLQTASTRMLSTTLLEHLSLVPSELLERGNLRAFAQIKLGSCLISAYGIWGGFAPSCMPAVRQCSFSGQVGLVDMAGLVAEALALNLQHHRSGAAQHIPGCAHLRTFVSSHVLCHTPLLDTKIFEHVVRQYFR